MGTQDKRKEDDYEKEGKDEWKRSSFHAIAERKQMLT